MIKMKTGGIILTGVAAFVVCGKLIDIAKTSAIGVCETAKWRGYYKCWSKGKATGEPIPPGYSRTYRPDNAKYEIVDDPSGKDHTNDNAQEEPKKPVNTDAVKTICEAAKAIAEKVINDLSGKKQAPEEAKESETEASESDIPENPNTYDDGQLRDQIDIVFTKDNNVDDELEKSIEEARKAGVPENDILHDSDEIDEFFTK